MKTPQLISYRRSVGHLSIFLAFFIFNFSLSAQNVGIGVSDPKEKLDVDGDIQLTDTLIYENQGKLYVKNDSVFFINTNSVTTMVDLKYLSISDHPSLTTNLVSYWGFDTDATDEHAGNDGTVNSATHTSGNNGKIGECYSYDGIDDYIDFNSTVSSTNSYTRTCWMYFNNVSSDIAFSANWYYHAVNQYYGLSFAYIASTKDIRIAHCTGGAWPTHYTYAMPLETGIWYFFALTYDATSRHVKLYVNGQFVLNYEVGPNLVYHANTVERIGAVDYNSPVGSSGGEANFVNGKIDEFGYWSRALSTFEIEDLYNRGSGLPYD